jgi:hypothetical protein
MKYIMRLFEYVNHAKLLDINDMTVKFINPDGEEVSVEMEPDGEWEEWEEYPYVKSVSVSGSDGKYEYYMSAYGDEHSGYEISDSDFDLMSFEDIKKKEEKRKKENEERHARLKKEREEHQRQYEKDLADSGLSESDYRMELKLKDQWTYVYLFDHPHTSPDSGEGSHFAIAKVRVYEFDEGKIESAEIRRYKIPLHDAINLDDPNWEQEADLLGLDYDPKQWLYDARIIGSRDTEFVGIESPTEHQKKDPREFLNRAPYFANIDYYLN